MAQRNHAELSHLGTVPDSIPIEYVPKPHRASCLYHTVSYLLRLLHLFTRYGVRVQLLRILVLYLYIHLSTVCMNVHTCIPPMYSIPSNPPNHDNNEQNPPGACAPMIGLWCTVSFNFYLFASALSRLSHYICRSFSFPRKPQRLAG